MITPTSPENPIIKNLPGFGEAINEWRRLDKTRRLWSGDGSLWTSSDEADWLGWLTAVESQLEQLEKFEALASEIKAGGFKHALLLGMGGSALCPAVLASTFRRVSNYPHLLVLDSTDPAQIRRFVMRIDFRRTLFIVSSKSGTTVEPNILEKFFYEGTRQIIPDDQVGAHFIAITDPNSKLEELAKAKGFRGVFHGVPSIGGRFSALSDFGMIPAAACGFDVKTFLTRTEEMVHACGPTVPVEENPGVALGLALGVAALHGHDKITLTTSQDVWPFGAWVEQLLAESTGKNGKGLIPIYVEELSPPQTYQHDRLFCYIRHRDFATISQDEKVNALEEAGYPVVRIDFSDKYDLGQEFFRWEFATAVAGSLLGINPFNQPDVEASKIAARQLISRFETEETLPARIPLAEDGQFQLFTDPRNSRELLRLADGNLSVACLLKAHLDRLKLGDYFAMLAFVDMNETNTNILQKIRHELRDAYKVATMLQFGPRYLHSTGQLFKGGPDAGVFLQVTGDDLIDLPVPDEKYTFGTVKAAQARGDLEVLCQRDRRVLQIHLPGDTRLGLHNLRELVTDTLREPVVHE